MKMIPILLASGLLAGCAFDSFPGTRSPATQIPQAAASLPPMGHAQDIGSSNVRRAITGSCGMESVEHYVGQPRLSINAALLPENYRVLDLRTDGALDYQGNRLTIRINGDDVVESMSCG
ncbi:MAG: hypothetical protein P8J78_04000 [Maricaulis sp.]|nr:hypothetical protein [Maricaulis sp.]